LYSSTLTMNAVGAITLTLLNILAAGVVICLGFLDNRHSGKKTLNLRPERRTPVYLAIAIFLSNLLFCVREIKEMQGMDNGEVEVQGTSDCIAVNQVTWWGRHPSVRLVLRNRGLASTFNYYGPCVLYGWWCYFQSMCFPQNRMFNGSTTPGVDETRSFTCSSASLSHFFCGSLPMYPTRLHVAPSSCVSLPQIILRLDVPDWLFLSSFSCSFQSQQLSLDGMQRVHRDVIIDLLNPRSRQSKVALEVRMRVIRDNAIARH
jgi:hypothetical protein